MAISQFDNYPIICTSLKGVFGDSGITLTFTPYNISWLKFCVVNEAVQWMDGVLLEYPTTIGFQWGYLKNGPYTYRVSGRNGRVF